MRLQVVLRSRPLNHRVRELHGMARPKGHRKPPAEKKPPLTHFLCIPLVTPASRPHLEQSLQAFRSQVCRTANDVGYGTTAVQQSTPEDTLRIVPPKAIRPVGALHLTLGVMSLSAPQLREAIESLENLDLRSMLREAASSPNDPEPSQDEKPAGQSNSQAVAPIKVSLKGLTSMHAKHSTSILYMDPQDPSNRLYSFCLALEKKFSDAGFLLDQNRDLKLHATVVNMTYAKERKRRPPPRAQAAGASINNPAANDSQDDGSEGHGPNAKTPFKIDATRILDKFEEFAWAEDVVLDRLAICEMGAKKRFDDDGRLVDESYTEVATVPLPS